MDCLHKYKIVILTSQLANENPTLHQRISFCTRSRSFALPSKADTDVADVGGAAVTGAKFVA